NLIRPIGTLFAVANGSGILPVGRGMDRSAVEWAMIAWWKRQDGRGRARRNEPHPCVDVLDSVCLGDRDG
ncbi:MAG: hypothetical protein ACYTEQ_20525, partial [Planctomycetota bacterium]